MEYDQEKFDEQVKARNTSAEEMRRQQMQDLDELIRSQREKEEREGESNEIEDILNEMNQMQQMSAEIQFGGGAEQENEVIDIDAEEVE
jgi:hypothetical protein